MSIDVTVTDNVQASQVYGLFDAVISLRSRARDVGFSHPNHLIVEFGDVIALGDDAPTKDDLYEILTFVDQLVDENRPHANILIHCRMGISRSTAVALIVDIVFNNKTFKAAYDRLFEQRPVMWPNQLLLKHFDDSIVMNSPAAAAGCGSLADFDAKWKGEQSAKGLIIF